MTELINVVNGEKIMIDWFKEEKEEFEELKKDAEQGDADAQYKLAIAYEKGWSVEKDPEEAKKWYEKVVWF